RSSRRAPARRGRAMPGARGRRRARRGAARRRRPAPPGARVRWGRSSGELRAEIDPVPLETLEEHLAGAGEVLEERVEAHPESLGDPLVGLAAGAREALPERRRRPLGQAPAAVLERAPEEGVRAFAYLRRAGVVERALERIGISDPETRAPRFARGEVPRDA